MAVHSIDDLYFTASSKVAALEFQLEKALDLIVTQAEVIRKQEEEIQRLQG